MKVRGIASHGWINRFLKQSGTIPGILGFDDAALVDSEMSELRTAIAALEKQQIYFSPGSARLDQSQTAVMERLLATLEKIQSLYKSMAMAVRVAVVGQTDPSGRWARNLELSRKRAEAVMSWLIQHGVDPTNMHIVGSTIQPSTGVSPLTRESQVYRSVMFKAFIGAD